MPERGDLCFNYKISSQILHRDNGNNHVTEGLCQYDYRYVLIFQLQKYCLFFICFQKGRYVNQQEYFIKDMIAFTNTEHKDECTLATGEQSNGQAKEELTTRQFCRFITSLKPLCSDSLGRGALLSGILSTFYQSVDNSI